MCNIAVAAGGLVDVDTGDKRHDAGLPRLLAEHDFQIAGKAGAAKGIASRLPFAQLMGRVTARHSMLHDRADGPVDGMVGKAAQTRIHAEAPESVQRMRLLPLQLSWGTGSLSVVQIPMHVLYSEPLSASDR